MPDELTHHLRRRRMETCAYQPNYVLIPARLLPSPPRAMLYAAAHHFARIATARALRKTRYTVAMYYVYLSLFQRHRRAGGDTERLLRAKHDAFVGKLNIRGSRPKL